MKLGELLTEQKDGKDALFELLEKKNLVEASETLTKNTDEDYGFVTTSSFLTESVKDLPSENTDVIASLNNINYNFSKIENKKLEVGFIPRVFGRIQLDYIKENYEIIQEELENKKTLKTFDKEKISKILGFIKFSAKLIAEESKNNTFFLEDFSNKDLNEAVTKQEELFNTAINY